MGKEKVKNIIHRQLQVKCKPSYTDDINIVKLNQIYREDF